jgi:hypothetical protein
MKVSDVIVLSVSAAMLAAAWMMFQSEENDEYRERHGTIIIEDVSDEN